MAVNARQWVLKQRPSGAVEEQHFQQQTVSLDAQSLQNGECLAETLWLGFEPAMRGWLDDVKSYLPPVAIGEVMRAPTVCRILESRHPEWQAGDLLMGLTGWQDFALLNEATLAECQKLPTETPPNMALSIFGGTSLTAWFGLMDVGQPKAGETVLVSGAAGATGSVVCQIAKHQGCHVIGLAGSADKCQWLTETCGIDIAINYRDADWLTQLQAAAGDGIDLFFDNVGGETLEAGIDNMSDHGRIVLCGAISQYNSEQPSGPRNMMQVIARRLRLQGFIMLDYVDRMNEAMDALLPLVMEGKLHWREDVQTGFENIPATFIRLFRGDNQGKQLLQLKD